MGGSDRNHSCLSKNLYFQFQKEEADLSVSTMMDKVDVSRGRVGFNERTWARRDSASASVHIPFRFTKK